MLADTKYDFRRLVFSTLVVAPEHHISSDSIGTSKQLKPRSQQPHPPRSEPPHPPRSQPLHPPRSQPQPHGPSSAPPAAGPCLKQCIPQTGSVTFYSTHTYFSGPLPLIPCAPRPRSCPTKPSIQPPSITPGQRPGCPSMLRECFTGIFTGGRCMCYAYCLRTFRCPRKQERVACYLRKTAPNSRIVSLWSCLLLDQTLGLKVSLSF